MSVNSPPPPYPGTAAGPIQIDENDEGEITVDDDTGEIAIIDTKPQAILSKHIDRIRQRRRHNLAEKRAMRAKQPFGCPRDPIWYNWQYIVVSQHYETLVTEGRWSELEAVLDGEANARGRPQCSKKSSAIRQHLEDMDLMDIINKGMCEDEPVVLTHDEHEFLAGANGTRILQASRSRGLAGLSEKLCQELEDYSADHLELNIHPRPSDKLYDILKTQVADRKGWFHLIHQRHKKQQEAIAEVQQDAVLRLKRALHDQKKELEAEYEKKMRAFLFRDRQLLRGG